MADERSLLGKLLLAKPGQKGLFFDENGKPHWETVPEEGSKPTEVAEETNSQQHLDAIDLSQSGFSESDRLAASARRTVVDDGKATNQAPFIVNK